MNRLEVTVSLNVDDNAAKANMRSALARGLPPFEVCNLLPAASIVAGGPSLADTVSDISGPVLACNGAARYLADKGKTPEFCVIADARPEIADIVSNPVDGCTYLVASQCDPAVFDALDGHDVRLWHLNNAFGWEEDFLRGTGKYVLVGGGSTAGLRAMYLAYLMGARKFDLYGFDSCYAADAHHAYAQDFNDDDTRNVIPVFAAGRLFACAPWMAAQAKEFFDARRALADADVTIHGDGLISWMALKSQQNPELVN